MDVPVVHSLTIISSALPLADSTAPILKRVTEQHFARFRAAITDPHHLASFHADATIALIPTDDQVAARSSLKIARRAQQRQRKVQFLFTTESHEFVAERGCEFILDLRDQSWGTAQLPCFGGCTAEEMRLRLSSIVAARQIWDGPDEGGEDTILLNGRRIYLIDEREEGVFSCVAPGNC